MTIKARVRDGRLVIDEPINQPEGPELELLPYMAPDALARLIRVLAGHAPHTAQTA